MKTNRTQKAAILLAAIACTAIFLSGGKPKLVGEDKAKEAGLAFINKVFDVNVSEVIVTKGVRAGVTYVDGEYQETGNEQPITLYIVAIPPNQYGLSDYMAFVNAETGWLTLPRRVILLCRK